MKVVYTTHLKRRILVRRIPEQLPSNIVRHPEQVYYDTITKRFIAIALASYAGKKRFMAVVYDRHQNRIELITVHPIRKQEINNRLQSKRWTYEKT